MAFRFAIVDDAPFIRELLKILLEKAGGVCVGEAETGRGGLELVQKFLPDLIMLDLVMPEKNGLDLVKDYLEVWPDLKIIACSTLDQEAIVQKAKTLGVTAYLKKPFTQDQLNIILQKLKFIEKELQK